VGTGEELTVQGREKRVTMLQEEPVNINEVNIMLN